MPCQGNPPNADTDTDAHTHTHVQHVLADGGPFFRDCLTESSCIESCYISNDKKKKQEEEKTKKSQHTCPKVNKMFGAFLYEQNVRILAKCPRFISFRLVGPLQNSGTWVVLRES